MEGSTGYHSIISQMRLQPKVIKQFLSKPFVRTSMLMALGFEMFQTGGVLGSRYRSCVETFGTVFLGLSGPPGAMMQFLSTMHEKGIKPHVSQATTIYDFVASNLVRRLGHVGDWSEYFVRNRDTKVWLEPAAIYMHDCANYGAALGVCAPDEFRAMFERSHRRPDPKKWAEARQAGADIPAEPPPVATYTQVEQNETEFFVEYCRQYLPALLVGLGEPAA